MISQVIKYMRESSGFSQVQLADKLSIAQTTLSGYKTGYSKPNYEIIEKIAELCEFDIVFKDKNNGAIIDIKKRTNFKTMVLILSCRQ